MCAVTLVQQSGETPGEIMPQSGFSPTIFRASKRGPTGSENLRSNASFSTVEKQFCSKMNHV